MSAVSRGARVNKITYIKESSDMGRKALVGIPRDIADAMQQMGAVYLGWELCANGDIRLHLLERSTDMLHSDHGVSIEEWVKEA